MIPILQSALLARLVQVHGWEANAVNPHPVTQDFNTAVGPKKATIWANTCAETGQVFLSAEYNSEGRNVAANCITSVPAHCGDAEMLVFAKAHHDKVVRSVDESYARRLLLRFPAIV
jgi:hypothetical protein